MPLFKINHDHRSKLWCGPAAIAAVTGHPTSTIYRVVQANEKRNRIMGMFPGELNRAMHSLGYTGKDEMHPRGMTLAQFAAAHSDKFAQHPMIVATTEHFVVLHGRRFVDNVTQDPVWIKDAPHRRARVEWACAWVKVRDAVIPKVAAPKQRSNDMAKARRLAAKHGVDIEPERYPDGMCYWVTCPELADDDPFEGDHFATDASEVLAKVERYIEHLTGGYLEAVTAPCMLPESHPGYRPGVI